MGIVDLNRNAAPMLHGPEYAAVAEALAVGQYGHSTATEQFERELAEFLQVPDVVAVSSCTAALHLSLLLAGVGPGDEVIVPSQTFCATIHAIRAVGAYPVFVEHDDNLCITAETVLAALSPATRAVLPVLYGGRAIDLTSIQPVLDERGVAVVEDAAHAFGSYQGGRRVGATGVLTCFSFGPIKALSAIEGGGLVPRTPQDSEQARALRMLGITQSQAQRIASTSYQVDGPGFRYHLSAVHAAAGRVQLARFDVIETARKNLWRAYAAALAGMDSVRLVDVDIDRTTPFHCVVRIPAQIRDTVHMTMRAQRLGVGVHYPPNHLQPAFAPWHRPLPFTEAAASQILSLPFHPDMTAVQAQHVVAALDRAIRDATRNTPLEPGAAAVSGAAG